jgi:TetR/AcrR family transcriptional regulator, transcriptional repressor for nem operon
VARAAAVLQGGYILARAANAVELFSRAVEGALGLLGAVRAD